jgi:uncharacterized protein YkwD
MKECVKLLDWAEGRMDYFTRIAGISGMPGLIATLCKYLLIWLVLGPVLFPGAAFEARAKTYLEMALGSLKNLPADARIREDLESVIAGQANAYRQSKGISSLQASSRLRDAARAQAIDMMLNGYVGHKASSGHAFDSRMRAFLGGPVMMMPSMAENAARDTQKGEADAGKARRLFQQWVESRPHRKTLLNSGYKFVSTGVVQRGNKIWAVQIFFAPLPEGMKVLEGSGLY